MKNARNHVYPRSANTNNLCNMGYIIHYPRYPHAEIAVPSVYGPVIYDEGIELERLVAVGAFGEEAGVVPGITGK